MASSSPTNRTHFPVIIVGGGQAGLSVSYCLQQKGIEHIIFEKHKVAHSWESKRWDSFCLVTPNWQCMLPGYAYPGDDPEGFMQRDEIVQYVRDYAQSFLPNLREGVAVDSIEENVGEGISDTNQRLFKVTTSIGEYSAEQVVIATGGYHQPKIPHMSAHLPSELLQLHSSEYKNPQSLPEGGVLVVGTGQSGCQIAEDLHLAGKQVHLCVGGAPRSPREYRGKDVVAWLDELGYYDTPIDEHPQKEKVRTKTNHYVTGRGGGREIDLRQFATEGMKLYGRLNVIEGATLSLKDDLAQNLDYADSVAESIKGTIDEYIKKNNIDAPVEPAYEPAWEPKEAVRRLDLDADNIQTLIWATGYHMDFNWIALPAFDDGGYPTHQRGVTTVEGLYFIGLPWLYTWGSGRFSGIARDAAYLSEQISEQISGQIIGKVDMPSAAAMEATTAVATTSPA
ncbi:MAG: MSMEG_0569 family flavin-dependent oxidoreductase [Cyanobacteria bacterium P01_D01_bin.105]